MKASNASSKKKTRTAAPRAAVAQTAPFTNLRFAVGVEGLQDTAAVEVVFPVARIVTAPRQRRRVQFEPLVIRRGLTASTEWYDWWHAARRATRVVLKRRVTVVLHKDDGSEGVRWFFPDSVPVSYALSPLNALAGAAVIESLELQVGGFELFRRE